MPREPEGTKQEAERIFAVFKAAGGIEFDADILQPAGIQLDLYGEDIRSRAFVLNDPERGELVLRPDFTVPISSFHLSDCADSRRYVYAGRVFRRQIGAVPRPDEYLQVGFEDLGRRDRALADAEAFALVFEALDGFEFRSTTGDIGILKEAVEGLDTTPRRKNALLRHIWRPNRFQGLLEQFSDDGILPALDRLVRKVKKIPVAELAKSGGPAAGERTVAEIEARIEALAADAAAPPLEKEQVKVLEAIVRQRGASPIALESMRKLERDLPGIKPALDRMEDRLCRLEQCGIAVDALEFDARFGRTMLEYYDGFVFGFRSPTDFSLPLAASGGRYDALTRIIGKGREIPAVGAIVRPAVLREQASSG
ncbi:MAG: ATP phosphoribosyltransferase regulatory subunit [Albidovulum sp.]|nr:ATP phosphoribosyltransferase regulatory subunit [Albidovulum sp.]